MNPDSASRSKIRCISPGSGCRPWISHHSSVMVKVSTRQHTSSAAKTIDRVVDVSLVPNPPMGVPPSGQLRPQPTFKQSDLIVHGIQFGLEWRW